MTQEVYQLGISFILLLVTGLSVREITLTGYSSRRIGAPKEKNKEVAAVFMVVVFVVSS